MFDQPSILLAIKLMESNVVDNVRYLYYHLIEYNKIFLKWLDKIFFILATKRWTNPKDSFKIFYS